jgi:hypothetical protein
MLAALVIALVALAALAVTQAVLPPLISSRVEERLTRGGGSARVSIRSFPALRLLLGDGSRILVRGEDLRLGLGEGGDDVFGRLQGFRAVAVRLTDVTVGPLRIASLRLDRDGGEPYRLRAAASGMVPLTLDMRLAMDEGRIRIVGGGSTVAGYPTGRLGEAIAGAVLASL